MNIGIFLGENNRIYIVDKWTKRLRIKLCSKSVPGVTTVANTSLTYRLCINSTHFNAIYDPLIYCMP